MFVTTLKTVSLSRSGGYAYLQAQVSLGYRYAAGTFHAAVPPICVVSQVHEEYVIQVRPLCAPPVSIELFVFRDSPEPWRKAIAVLQRPLPTELMPLLDGFHISFRSLEPPTSLERYSQAKQNFAFWLEDRVAHAKFEMNTAWGSVDYISDVRISKKALYAENT